MLTFAKRIALAGVLAFIPNAFYDVAYRVGWEKFLNAFGFTGVGLLWNPFFINFLLAIPFITFARKTILHSGRMKTVYTVLLGIMGLVCFWPSVSSLLIMISMSRWSRP